MMLAIGSLTWRVGLMKHDAATVVVVGMTFQVWVRWVTVKNPRVLVMVVGLGVIVCVPRPDVMVDAAAVCVIVSNAVLVMLTTGVCLLVTVTVGLMVEVCCAPTSREKSRW